MQIQSYQQLTVWKKSIALTKEVYESTGFLLNAELYGLSSQMRRSAVSVASNIAEGYKRRSLGDYIRFLCIADGSAAELETQLLVARNIYPEIDFSFVDRQLEEVQKMLSVLIKRLEEKK